MRVNIISIGNSKGIRIPKALLNQCQIHEEVDLVADGKKIVIKPTKDHPRKDWGNRFADMAKNKDDVLIINDLIDIKDNEWTW
ncbi:MAG: AbrB/MazE/SpoVT family DNA-binding domain-containing protein [Candidatus Omnitrophica bacterium]|nr:AbrB/MazE/SpoVT family DNA-binding domain-containing protein [Candidatus Omnitrophota bacterium]